MILIDTSSFSDFFRVGNSHIQNLLSTGNVVIHPMVFAELALGQWRHRSLILQLLQDLLPASTVTDRELFSLIEVRKLYSKGIGYVDAHLIASSLLGNYTLITNDKALKRAAESVGVRLG